MKSIIKIFRYFIKYSKLTIARQMQYRLNFFLSTTIALVGTSIGPLIQLLIVTNTRGYPGWTLEQVFLFQGILLFTSGFSNMLFGNVKNHIIGLVRKGDLDVLLLKPIPTIGTIISSGFNLEQLGSIFAGLWLIIWASLKLNIVLSPLMLIAFFIAILSGIIIHMAINIIFSAIAVKIVFTGRLAEIFHAISGFANYPLELFPKAVQIVFLFLIPFAVMVYIPTRVLLGHISINIITIFAVSIMFFLISLLIWIKSIRKYSSAGG